MVATVLDVLLLEIWLFAADMGNRLALVLDLAFRTLLNVLPAWDAVGIGSGEVYSYTRSAAAWSRRSAADG